MAGGYACDDYRAVEERGDVDVDVVPVSRFVMIGSRARESG